MTQCGGARMQFQMTGNRISGTGAGPNWQMRVNRSSNGHGVGTIVWSENNARGTIKFTGDGFEARLAVPPCNWELIFSGGRVQ
jgi:hypothetical protein